ncbi:MAG TPA: LCCL domain-containing protein [Vicinamibacterales bacterium]|nr:LCCL domain-containing protein [Vicinamibacterales bacterium]
MKFVVIALVASVGAAPATAQQTSAPRPGVVITNPPSPPPGAMAIPPLSPDAQRLVDQWKLDHASIIEQLRALQLAYRDAGRAEDAAAIAANVRALQQRIPPVSPTLTADLVNDGLPGRDEPVRMALFRDRAGETLSFSIRGRDDQPVWGTKVYTDDSALETAAVHAGVLRPGQRGIVKVRVLPGQDHYDGTKQHDVDSTAFGRHPGSFQFMGVSISRPVRTNQLSSYRDLVGQSIVLPVVGSAKGSVWGSDVYTDDSSVGAAAVHAGLVSVGDFAFVKVTLLPGQARYEGTARNGVTSETYEQWEGSFRLEPAAPPWIVQLPGGEDASRLVELSGLRTRTGTSFVVQVVGVASGSVWGSGTYTDDSSIAAAAVHAGLLKPGETGMIRVTTAAGQAAYVASEQNGIKSQAYGPFEGSFRLERVK